MATLLKEAPSGIDIRIAQGDAWNNNLAHWIATGEGDLGSRRYAGFDYMPDILRIAKAVNTQIRRLAGRPKQR